MKYFKEGRMSVKSNILEAHWYHKIKLPGGVVTPGNDWDYLWDNIRDAKKNVNYTEKEVLDLGAMEGLWAFEAEQSGASRVITVDRDLRCSEKLLYCKGQLGSAVKPFFNVPIERLEERIGDHGPFDIVQHLGLLYHLMDPLSSLFKCRALVREGGLLVMETAVERSLGTSALIFNGVKPADFDLDKHPYWWRMYNGGHPQWMVTMPCLKEMMLSAGFVPMLETISFADQPSTSAINEDAADMRYDRCRVALVAKAVDSSDITQKVIDEIMTS